MTQSVFDAAAQADWLEHGAEQLPSYSPFLLAPDSGLLIPDIEKSAAGVKKQIQDFCAAGMADEQALMLSLSLGNLGLSRAVLDMITAGLKASGESSRQSTVFQFVHVEGEYQACLSLAVEHLAELASGDGSEESRARSHGLLLCTHELLSELSRLVTACRLHEPGELWDGGQNPAAAAVNLNRRLLAEQQKVGAPAEVIAQFLGI